MASFHNEINIRSWLFFVANRHVRCAMQNSVISLCSLDWTSSKIGLSGEMRPYTYQGYSSQPNSANFIVNSKAGTRLSALPKLLTPSCDKGWTACILCRIFSMPQARFVWKQLPFPYIYKSLSYTIQQYWIENISQLSALASNPPHIIYSN